MSIDASWESKNGVKCTEKTRYLVPARSICTR